MSGETLVGEFIGFVVISVITFFVIFGGAIVFGKNIPLETIAGAAAFFGLVFYGLYKGVLVRPPRQ